LNNVPPGPLSGDDSWSPDVTNFYSTSENGNHTHSLSISTVDNHAHLIVIPVSKSSDAGSHAHSIDIPESTSSTTNDHVHLVSIPESRSSTTDDHEHTVSVSSGGSATPINIAPKTLSVNMFMYLGL